MSSVADSTVFQPMEEERIEILNPRVMNGEKIEIPDGKTADEKKMEVPDPSIMKEKRLEIPVTLKKVDLQDTHHARRNSTGKIDISNNRTKIVSRYQGIHHERRNSTGKIEISNNKTKIVSRYLRDSIGSCHDFCKFGKTHSFDDINSNYPLQKKIQTTPPQGHFPSRMGISAERNEKSVIPSKAKVPQKTTVSADKVALGSLRSKGNNGKTIWIEKGTGPWNPNIWKNSGIGIGKQTGASETGGTKIFSSPKQPASHARNFKNLRGISYAKTRNKVRKPKSNQPIEEQVEEKTLYVIEMKTAPSSDSTLSKGSKILSEKNEMKIDTQMEKSKGDYKVRPKKGGKTQMENTDYSPRKLSFQRGKVVELQNDNNGARKLRFRKVRMGGDQNGKNDMKRRSFRNTEAGEGGSTSSIETEKVVLRHRDFRGKKTDLNLFNNVIEETASKLVKTRKSKVKALVGAFETVISLQETKPSTLTT